MGGLRKKLPVTFWTMTAAVFAIAGFRRWRLFSRRTRFSTPRICMARRNGAVVCGLVTHADGALYVPAVVPDVYGRGAQPGDSSARESVVDAGPLVILALLSIGAGGLASSALLRSLRRRLGRVAESNTPHLELILSGAAVAVGFWDG